MKPTDLAIHLSRFFTDHLAGERNASPNTIKAYRDAFKLLLRYCRDHLGTPPERLIHPMYNILCLSQACCETSDIVPSASKTVVQFPHHLREPLNNA